MLANKIEKLPTSNNVGKKQDKLTKRKLSRYEKALLRPLKVISTCSIVAMGLNLFLPLYSGSLGISHLLQWVMCLIYVLCIANSRGLTTEYSLSIGKILTVRIIEVGFSLVRKSVLMNYGVFFILILFDTLLVAYMAYHKVNYEFEVEKYVR